MLSENQLAESRADSESTTTATDGTARTAGVKTSGKTAATPTNGIQTTDKQRAIYYLHAEFTVHRKNHRSFELLITRLMSVVHELFGWELVQASYPISGEVNRFTHIWRISTPDSILDVMRHGAFDFFGSASAAHERGKPLQNYFKRIYREIQKVVEDTTHQLTTSLPHDPNSAGYQSQTLLVDVDGDIFIMDHEKMREAWQSKDISRELLAARQLRNYLLWGPHQLEAQAHSQAGGEVKPPSYLDRPDDEEEKAFDALVKKLERIQADLPGDLEALRNKAPHRPSRDVVTIQNLLNEGVTHARVQRRGETALLVNLAALKARPVLQQSFDITKHVRDDKDKKQVGVALGEGNGAFDAKRLLIATPWGSVYDVDAGDINACAVQINDDDATSLRVAPIVEHQATLASVLEAPDDVIGDGCVCYVINLSSFCGGASFGQARETVQKACRKAEQKRRSSAS